MKQKILIIEEYECSKQDNVKHLMNDMLKEPEVNLDIRLLYDEVPLSKKVLDNFADTVKAVGKEHEFLVDITVITHQWKNVKRLRKTLNQYSIGVELRISDSCKPLEIKKYTKKMVVEKILICCKNYQQFLEGYNYWKQTGVPIQLEGYELSLAEYQKFFEVWVHDAQAVWFLPFEDMISSLLTGVHIDTCEHSSCMGKYLYLDKEEQVYFCSKKKEKTQMYSLKQGQPIYLYNEVYDTALHHAIEKRRQCKNECQMFGICRGECPLKEKTQESCREYMQKVSCVGNFLDNEIKDAFVRVENPCMRQLYLSLIAYGFDFVSKE